MHHARRAVLGILAALPLGVTAACGSGLGADAASPAPAPVAPPQPVPGPVLSAAPAVAIPVCGPFPVPPVDAAAFPDSTQIDNRWFPLVPGTQFVLEAYANRDGALRGHQIVSTVTDLTKVINGVPTVVVWQVDRNQGTLAESKLAFFAQDRDGNVWSFGQYPELYANGKLTGAPKTWLSGLSGASAGLVVRGEPRPGSTEFLQASAPSTDLLDCARDVRTGERTCVTNTCYDGVTVVDERSGASGISREPGIQRQYYAPGVGTVRSEAVGNLAGETLLLVTVVTLDPNALATARKSALELEKRAYQTSPNGVYRQNPPAIPRP